MSILRIAGVALVVAACAGGRLPESGDPMVSIGNAERAVAEAKAAGADSLASTLIAEAQAGIDAAKAASSGNRNRAALLARRAQADAMYAQSFARKVLADRAKAAAQAELNTVPPPGGAR
jgi:hypothetical protein